MPIIPLDALPELPENDANPPKSTGGVERISVPAALIESDIDLQRAREAAKLGREMRGRGYRMYMDGMSPSQISEALATPAITEDVVLLWAREGDWAVRLRKYNDSREELVRENLRAIRLSKAEDEASSSLRIGKKIRDKAETMLEDEDLTPMGLKNVADAAKASGDLGAHGMGESAVATAEDKVKGKVPLVMIFPGGGLPPVPKTVEFTEVKPE